MVFAMSGCLKFILVIGAHMRNYLHFTSIDIYAMHTPAIKVL